MPDTVDRVEGERKSDDSLSSVLEPLGHARVHKVDDMRRVERDAGQWCREVCEKECIKACIGSVKRESVRALQGRRVEPRIMRANREPSIYYQHIRNANLPTLSPTPVPRLTILATQVI